MSALLSPSPPTLICIGRLRCLEHNDGGREEERERGRERDEVAGGCVGDGGC